MTNVHNNLDEYRGFLIDAAFRIFKNNKQVFTANWQTCHSKEQAKAMIDASISAKEELTNYQEMQADKYQNVLQQPEIMPDGHCDIEANSEEMLRFEQWNNEMAERQLMEYEY